MVDALLVLLLLLLFLLVGGGRQGQKPYQHPVEESGVDDVSKQDYRTPDNVWGIIQSGKKGGAVKGKEADDYCYS